MAKKDNCFYGWMVFAAWFSSYRLLKIHDSPLSLSPGLWSWSDPRSNVKPRPSGKMLKSLREEIEKKSNQKKFLVHFSHLTWPDNPSSVRIYFYSWSDNPSRVRILISVPGRIKELNWILQWIPKRHIIQKSMLNFGISNWFWKALILLCM